MERWSRGVWRRRRSSLKSTRRGKDLPGHDSRSPLINNTFPSVYVKSYVSDLYTCDMLEISYYVSSRYFWITGAVD